MSARVDADMQSANAPDPPAVAAGALQGLGSVALDPDDRYGGNALPSDHPKWMKDTLSISQRARALLVRLKPVALRAIAYWEHRVRSIAIGGRNLSVDPSGSYRLD